MRKNTGELRPLVVKTSRVIKVEERRMKRVLMDFLVKRWMVITMARRARSWGVK